MRTPTPVAVWADAVPVPDPPTIRSAIPVAVWADAVPVPDPDDVLTPAPVAVWAATVPAPVPVTTTAPDTAPSSPRGAEANGENPSMCYLKV